MKKVVNENQKSTLRKVLRYIRRYWGYLGASIILAAVTVALTLYLPILIGQAVDRIVGKGAVDFAGIFVILRKMAVIIGLTAVAQWVMNACNNKITYNVIRDIRTEAFEKIEKLPLKYLDAHSYGEIVSRVIADVDQFADGLLMGFTQFFTGIVTIFDFHADDQRADHGGGRGHHAGLPVCGKLHCEKDIFHVQAAVGDKRRADRVYRGDGRQPESGAGIFP